MIGLGCRFSGFSPSPYLPAKSWRFPFIELGVPPCWRAYFFLLRQEKVAKKKATPGCAVGYANSPALLEAPGDSLNSPAAQTTRVEGPRPFSVARRSTWGPERRDGSSSSEIIRRLRSTGKNGKNEGGAALCIPPPPNPRHSRAGGSPGSAWIPAGAGMTEPSLNEPHLCSNPNRNPNQAIPIPNT